jgi:hypothetical protein
VLANPNFLDTTLQKLHADTMYWLGIGIAGLFQRGGVLKMVAGRFCMSLLSILLVSPGKNGCRKKDETKQRPTKIYAANSGKQ